MEEGRDLEHDRSRLLDLKKRAIEPCPPHRQAAAQSVGESQRRREPALLGHVVVFGCDRAPALERRMGPLEITQDYLSRAQSSQGVSQHHSIARGFSLLRDGACRRRLTGQVAAVALCPGQLGGDGERSIRLARLHVELARPVGGGLCRIEVSGRHGQEVAQADLDGRARSEEHTSELQSRPHLVCRLLLEKKKKIHCTKHRSKKKPKKKKIKK